MKLAIFMSGKAFKNLRFYSEMDSVASSVVIPKELEKDFINSLESRESLGEDVEFKLATKWDDVVPCIATGEIDDLVSDMVGENHNFYRDVHEILTMSENDCGYVHIIK